MIALIGTLAYWGSGRDLPQVGDHWHASLEVVICGKREPNLPPSPGGIHTHGDGMIHIHPASSAEVGVRANLGRFFDRPGLQFTASTIELPGGPVYKEGDLCPDGKPGHLRVNVNGRVIDDPRSYVPQDYDRIQISFGS